MITALVCLQTRNHGSAKLGTPNPINRKTLQCVSHVGSGLPRGAEADPFQGNWDRQVTLD